MKTQFLKIPFSYNDKGEKVYSVHLHADKTELRSSRMLGYNVNLNSEDIELESLEDKKHGLAWVKCEDISRNEFDKIMRKHISNEFTSSNIDSENYNTVKINTKEGKMCFLVSVDSIIKGEKKCLI